MKSFFAYFVCAASVFALSSCGTKTDHIVNTVYVTDTLHIKDTVLVPQPSPYPVISTLTNFVSGVQAPLGMVFDSTGNLYVVGVTGGTITQITPSGVTHAFASAGTYAGAIAISRSGDFYLACYGDATVKKVGPGGGTMTTVLSGLSNPSGIAFDTAGNMYVAEYDAKDVRKITPLGVNQVFAIFSQNPAGLVFDNAGNLYVGHQAANLISRVTPAGVVSPASFGVPSPHTMAFDKDGNMFVSESSLDSKTITVIAKDGYTYQLTNQMTWPTGMAFDKAGALFVSNYTGNAISKIVFKH